MLKAAEYVATKELLVDQASSLDSLPTNFNV